MCSADVSKCEAVDDIGVICEQCGKRTHVFWQDPVGKFIDYLRQSKPFADKVCLITQFSRKRRTVSAALVSGTELGTSINNGR